MDEHSDSVTNAPAHDSGHLGDNEGHDHHAMGSLNSMAASATLHCLTGCAIGEVAGLMIGTAIGLSNGGTIAISIALAFFFGYTLSTLPLLKAGLTVTTAMSVVVAADTLSILTMEVVDNLVMALIPGAMNAGLVNSIFWVGMMISLVVAYFAAYPVNRYLLLRGKGHALTHEYHRTVTATGARRYIPSIATSTLVTGIAAFLIGGWVVSIADGTGSGSAGEGADYGRSCSKPAANRPLMPLGMSHWFRVRGPDTRPGEQQHLAGSP